MRTERFVDVRKGAGGWRRMAPGIVSCLAAGILFLGFPTAGFCQEEEAEEEDSLGLEIEAAFSSLYYFRGDNLFKKDKLMDQNGLASLSVTYALGPVSIVYWGGFQTNGDNIGDNIDVGLGAEQDLAVSYTHELPADLAVEVGVLSYMYPFADEEAADTTFPVYLDPFVALSWSGFVDARMCVWWYLGVQDALKDYRYIYLNPSVGKEFALTPDLTLGVELVAGYKTYTLYVGANDEVPRDNLWDVLLKVGATYTFLDDFYVTPSVSAGWTNLDEKGEDGKEPGFGDEYMVFGGLAVGWAK
ncbi:MAG: hypothetical protein FJ109_10645 [Deltaproteobacteria bacterium]|nr:hypothetical protein [Deltaproteobacteria bacterium]